jgi:iron complex outermembrane recepter protein
MMPHGAPCANLRALTLQLRISAKTNVMKQLLTGILLWSTLNPIAAQSNIKFNDTTYLKPVEILAVRAADKAPFAKTTIRQADFEKNNLGQDIPFLLNQTPSVVVNADAGNGVGYTGIRIRGTDATRINLTLNGIPYNDAESQGTFLVNLPDFASSANSIQVQRGVGTSTNGAGAFGSTINIATNDIQKDFYAELNNSYGSFNTLKNTIKFGTGMLKNHFTIDGRLSRISSDGYIDRASSNLRAYYVSAAWLDSKNSLRLNIFSGKEKTYQAWNGVPENLLNSNRTYNSAGTEKEGSPYDNETDNYLQTHYQLFYNHQFNHYWKANLSLFLTTGQGYYEQYKAQQSLGDYGLPDYTHGGSTITETDLVRQLWLDNNFYGSIFSAQYQKNNTQLTIGGGINKYDGNHFGKITWAQQQAAVPAGHQWYNLDAFKTDINIFTKWTQQLGKHWQSFADLQLRAVQYDINGFRKNPDLKTDNHYTFFNPKLGITYTKNNWQAYLSYAIAAKEPNRDDFENGTTTPKPETLHDIEAGIEKRNASYSIVANLYYMRYKDQLVLVGNINDVGAYTRTNVPNSYRVGIELQGAVKLSNYLNASANITFSQSKIKHFTERIDDYDNGGTKDIFYKSTPISFSPAVISAATINILPFNHAMLSLVSKYISRQYMDNTGNKNRSLAAYYVQDIRLSYDLVNTIGKNASFIVQLNNVFNKKYSPNGYTFSYVYGGVVTENFYFPMATFNCMAGINIRF